MKETQGALGMLLRRYRLILGKCRLRNALAGLLLGAVLLAPAVSPADSGGKEGRPGHPESSHYTGTTDGASGPYTADGGHVIISNRAGDLDASSFYGGHADGRGDVTGNRVEMRDGTSRAANIYGGFTENGRASGNTVTVENGRIGGTWAGGRVYAGYSQAGDVHKNVLEIRDGHIEGSHTEVSAGYTKNGDSTGNSLTISGGSIRRTDAYHFVSAGFSREGNALGNTLTVTGGELGAEAYGGHVQTGHGDAADNRVEFSGSTSAVDKLTAGMSGGADVHGNTLVMNGGTVREFLTSGDSLRGLASGNKIEMHGGEVGKHVYAGYSDRGGASANELVIDGGTIAGNAFGSFIADNSTRNTEGSKISFGGTADVQFLTGAYSAKGDAAGNEVTVSGGTVHKNILGGDSGSGESRGNTVRVTGGTIGTQEQSGSVYGGYSTSGSAVTTPSASRAVRCAAASWAAAWKTGPARPSAIPCCSAAAASAPARACTAAIPTRAMPAATRSSSAAARPAARSTAASSGQARAMPPETPSSSKGLPIWAAPRCTAAARQAAAGTCAPAIRWKSAPRA